MRVCGTQTHKGETHTARLPAHPASPTPFLLRSIEGARFTFGYVLASLSTMAGSNLGGGYVPAGLRPGSWTTWSLGVCFSATFGQLWPVFNQRARERKLSAKMMLIDDSVGCRLADVGNIWVSLPLASLHSDGQTVQLFALGPLLSLSLWNVQCLVVRRAWSIPFSPTR